MRRLQNFRDLHSSKEVAQKKWEEDQEAESEFRESLVAAQASRSDSEPTAK
jgi:hypothetical protein